MIEALLLFVELFMVVVLLRAVRRTVGAGDGNLGVFSYVDSVGVAVANTTTPQVAKKHA